MGIDGNSNNNINRVYYVSIIAALLIWSTSFIGTKIAYATFPPITLGATRFIIASIILGILFVVKKEFVPPKLNDLGTIALSGVLGITLYFAMEKTWV